MDPKDMYGTFNSVVEGFHLVKYCIIENIKVDQSYYMVKVSKVGKKNFDRNLAKILPCYATEKVYTHKKDATYFLNLHPNHGFICDKELVEN